MPPPVVLCLVGARGAGKDTVADVLGTFGWRVTSFAGPLRQAVSALYGLPLDVFTDRQLKEEPIAGLGVSPRTLLQRIGTDVLRNHVGRAFADTAYHPPTSYFAHLVERSLVDETRPVVITDCRFPDELDYLAQTMPCVLPCVVRRPGIELVCTHSTDEWSVESTRNPPAGWPVIQNDGTIADLAAKLSLVSVRNWRDLGANLVASERSSERRPGAGVLPMAQLRSASTLAGRVS